MLHEPVGRLRFGLDVATAAVRRGRQRYDELALPFAVRTLGRNRAQTMPTRFAGVPVPATLSTWDDLSWTHVQLDEAGYLDVDATAPAAASGPAYWGGARTSATVARSMWQRPVAIVVPAARLL